MKEKKKGGMSLTTNTIMDKIWDFLKKLLSWFSSKDVQEKKTITTNPTKQNSIKQVKKDKSMTKETKNSTKKTLYALCVGINDYQHVGKLGGCVPDATNVYNYLKETSANTNFEFAPVLLTDDKATKGNIVKHFKEHLGKAKAGDVAVFYFSGHGAEEKADEVFWPYSQKKTLNTVVCYDSRNPAGVTDLSDKEIRYMIGKMTYNPDPKAELPHFVLMMDSCHSGGTTRWDEAKPRLTETVGARSWDKFIFADEISRDDVDKASSLKDVLPEGQHIHFGSCQGTQLAYEVRGSGVFTGTMLEILKRTSGQITYASLNDRIRYYVKDRFPQTPEIYSVKGEHLNPMKQYFLGGASAQKGLTADVLLNKKARKWILRMGAIQGIPSENFDDVKVEIVDLEGKPIVSATISEVQPDFCYIKPDDTDKLDIRESYNAKVRNIYRDPVGFYLDMDSDPTAMTRLKTGLDGIDSNWVGNFNVSFMDSYAAADYVVRVHDGHYEINRRGDDRPILEQQSTDLNDEKLMIVMPAFIKTIARRKFIDDLDNPKTQLKAADPSKPAASIEIYQVLDESDRSQDKLLSMNENNEVFVEEGDVLSVKTINNTRRNKLYFALMSLDTTFGVDAGLFGDNATEMLPREELWYDEKAFFDASFDDYILDFDFLESRTAFKLVASTATFSSKELTQDTLPPPIKFGEPEEINYRALKRRSAPKADDWMTTTVHIVMKNANGK